MYHPNNEYETNDLVGVSGTVIDPNISPEDLEFTHPFGHDFEFDIAPDAQYNGLLAGNQRRLGLETDNELVPSAYRPHDGDRVAAFGRWIVDAGHNDFHTEIHPPLLMASAHAASPDWTYSTVIGRPYLVSQEFVLGDDQTSYFLNRGQDDGAIVQHGLREIGKTLGIGCPWYYFGLPCSTRLEAHPGILAKPFSGVQTMDYFVQPQSPRHDPRDQLVSSYHLTVRSGVSVQFLSDAGPDAVHIRIRMNADAYTQAPLPRRREESFFQWQLLVAAGLSSLFSFNGPYATIIAARGVLTDRYDAPRAESPFDTGQNSVDTDNGQPFPIYGYLNVGWQRALPIHFRVDAQLDTVAGNAFPITVWAMDPSNNPDANYRGTVHFVSSDGRATLPTDHTFNGGDAGRYHVNGIVLRTAGSQTITVTDTADSTFTGSSTVAVAAAAASTLLVSDLPSTLPSNQPSIVTVSASDPYGNVTTGYRGTVRFTSTDGGGSLPGMFTFGAGDNGRHTWQNEVTLRTAGAQTITVTDVANPGISGTTIPPIIVTPAIASVLDLEFPIGIPIAGERNRVIVTALDSYGNRATGYRGTVHFTSSDGAATLPRDHTFSVPDGGIYDSSVILRTAGFQTIEIVDTANPLLYARVRFQVLPDVASSFIVIPDNMPDMPVHMTAGEPNGVAVIVIDPYGNWVTGYVGTVRFWSSDPAARLPDPFTFHTNDAGQHHLAEGITLFRAGLQTITVIDTLHPLLSGRVSVTVDPGTAIALRIEGPSSSPAGQLHNVRVTGRDLYGNTATDYRGTVHFTSSDPAAVLPADNYTFNQDDNGAHLFPVTLVTEGAQTISVTDDSGWTDHLSTDVVRAVLDPAVNYPLGFAPTCVAVGDVNGDGIPDLVAANNDGTVAVLFGNGNGTFQEPTVSNVPPFIGAIKVADLNRDHKADLVVARDGFNVSILFGNGDGTFGEPVDYFVGGGVVVDVEVSDFNGDGLPDLAINYRVASLGITFGITYYQLQVALNDPEHPGTFLDSYDDSYAAGDNLVPGRIVVGSFTGSGEHDILVYYGTLPEGHLPDAYQVIKTYQNIGDGTFFPLGRDTLLRNTFISSVTVADFNGDGLDDVLVGLSPETEGVMLLLNNGDGTFGALQATGDWSPIFVAAGDFNGDGIVDIGLYSSHSGPFDGNGAVEVFIGNGDTTFTSAGKYGVGVGAIAAVVADLNQDGLLDLVVANAVSQDISVLLNRGTAPRPASRTTRPQRVPADGTAFGSSFLPNLSMTSSHPAPMAPIKGAVTGLDKACVDQLFGAATKEEQDVISMWPRSDAGGEDGLSWDWHRNDGRSWKSAFWTQRSTQVR